MTFRQDPDTPRKSSSQRPGALVPTLSVLAAVVVVVLIVAHVQTEWAWYSQLGFSKVYGTQILTRAAIFVVVFALTAGGIASSLITGYRARPVYASLLTEQASLDRYRENVEPMRRLLVVGVPTVLGLFTASAASQQWQTVLLWLNRKPFGVKDEQFGKDVGFFVFSLPWWQFISGVLMAAVFLTGLAALATHYLYGGLRLQGNGPRLTPVARVHLGVLAAAFLLLRGVDNWLNRYALTTHNASRIKITGLSYTDANAVLTSRSVLAGISVIVAALFIAAVIVPGWRLLPLYGLGLYVLSSIVIGAVYPAVVQRFHVEPSEKALESPYIKKNINATRDAFGLKDMEVVPYRAKTKASAADLRADAAQIPGIRLLDPAKLSPTFRQLEQNKQYYSFPDTLDVDRYVIDGQVKDTVLAVRELDLERVPSDQRNWINDHLTYTHGFGVVAAYGNERGSEGRPAFFESGIPSSGKLGKYEPRVYFGESSPSYSIVGAPKGARPQELDYPDDNSKDGQQNNTYAGDGGVAMGSSWARMMFALRFRDQNILLSDQINEKSRIMFDRKPRERIAKVAPFLTLDGDPYPTVVNGRILWVVDAYTTTSRYPYSKMQELRTATQDSLTAGSSSVVPLPNQQINYIRNSVKATVDAFDGSVTLYGWDEKDPILKAWAGAFPGAIKPLSEMSGELMSHMRYPEDLFKVQRDLIRQYHVTDPEAYFVGQDFWRVPNDPTTGDKAVPALQPPYFLTLKMPGQTQPSFSMTSTFIPGGEGREVLTGFLAASGDAGSTAGVKSPDFGKLRLLQLPRDTVVPGPGQVQNNFNSAPEVSNQVTLLDKGQSSVILGNLLTLPMGDGLLYVEPLYVQSKSGSSYPLLKKVLVAFGDQIGFEDTLDAALNKVFSGAGPGVVPPGDNATPPAVGSGALAAALADAQKALVASNEARASGDWAAYGAAQKQLADAVTRALAAEAAAEKAAKAPAPAATPSPSASASPQG